MRGGYVRFQMSTRVCVWSFLFLHICVCSCVSRAVSDGVFCSLHLRTPKHSVCMLRFISEFVGVLRAVCVCAMLDDMARDIQTYRHEWANSLHRWKSDDHACVKYNRTLVVIFSVRVQHTFVIRIGKITGSITAGARITWLRSPLSWFAVISQKEAGRFLVSEYVGVVTRNSAYTNTQMKKA